MVEARPELGLIAQEVLNRNRSRGIYKNLSEEQRLNLIGHLTDVLECLCGQCHGDWSHLRWDTVEKTVCVTGSFDTLPEALALQVAFRETASDAGIRRTRAKQVADTCLKTSLYMLQYEVNTMAELRAKHKVQREALVVSGQGTSPYFKSWK
ncbi:MAG: hypothetical protein G01um10147_813 [Microgenomates group bacterium Gr01-1014_7]|nr:MAG: hypothetical protein G01um10147_813 [Microgenomates group bacterium Gr01-1014_7]